MGRRRQYLFDQGIEDAQLLMSCSSGVPDDWRKFICGFYITKLPRSSLLNVFFGSFIMVIWQHDSIDYFFFLPLFLRLNDTNSLQMATGVAVEYILMLDLYAALLIASVVQEYQQFMF